MNSQQEGENWEPLDKNGMVVASDVDFVDTWKAMEECVRKGLVRSIGVSNFNSQQIQRLMSRCTIKPVTNQVLHRKREARFHEFLIHFQRLSFLNSSTAFPFKGGIARLLQSEESGSLLQTIRHHSYGLRSSWSSRLSKGFHRTCSFGRSTSQTAGSKMRQDSCADSTALLGTYSRHVFTSSARCTNTWHSDYEGIPGHPEIGYKATHLWQYRFVRLWPFRPGYARNGWPRRPQSPLSLVSSL